MKPSAAACTYRSHLAPTLIFTLVLAGILRERFALDETLYGALLVYAVLTTIVPSFLLPKVNRFRSAG